jgi:hypothetical protein
MLFGKEQAGKGKRYFYEIAAICAENIPGHRLVEGKNLEGKNLIAGYPPPDEHVAPSLDDEPLHTE